MATEQREAAATELLTALQNPALYDHPVKHFSLIETHISWVLLTGDFVYKIKKPVKLAFLDFSTLEKRWQFCQDELRLNQRYAPDLYLDVVAIKGSTEKPRFEGKGKPIEYAIKMREFSQHDLLSTMASGHRLEPCHIDSMAKTIAGFHSDIAHPGNGRRPGSVEAIGNWSRENFENIEASIPVSLLPDCFDELKNWSLSTNTDRLNAIQNRLANGFIRECHGDLHLGNMVLIEEEVRMFDCIEFNEELRWIDTISEIAFAAMDLDARATPELCWRFINRYLEITGDYEGITLLRYYFVYRALVRAKVEALRITQEKPPITQKTSDYQTVYHYLNLAKTWAVNMQGMIIIMHGLSGSGKSTLASQLVEKAGAIQVRSDAERKRLFDLRAGDDSSSFLEKGIYSGDATQQTYDRLAALTKIIVKAGFTAIVDASFLKKPYRDQFKQLAQDCQVPLSLLSCEAPEKILRERIRRRIEENQDASEANLAVLKHQIASQDLISPKEQSKMLIMRCSKTELSQAQLDSLLQQVYLGTSD